MAIRLGNLDNEIQAQKRKENVEMEGAKASLLATIEEAKKLDLSGMMVDIIETYYYIKHNYPAETEFTKGLWSYLCRVSKNLDMSSYWAVEGLTHNPSHESGISVSKYGICVTSDEYGKYIDSDNVKRDCNGHDENVWRGKVLLEDYLSKNNVSTAGLNQWRESLLVLIRDFPAYAEGFFKLVDTHTIWKG